MRHHTRLSAPNVHVARSPAAAQPIANGAAQTNGHTTAAVPSTGRPYTVSIAVPGSVIDNTQTMELATAVAGQIARTAAIFNIDEVIVIDDSPAAEPGSVGAGAAFLARVLQFMETPQYLRKYVLLHTIHHGAGSTSEPVRLDTLVY